ncbi:hypothetical protein FGIG_10554 [Fasciola gigantica]|uniref:Large ribosomal subunit protein mL53 n=1 Tax=Fasciola gigantica TaxID=46835 RepID=A0A504YKL3_FASGI|nr:hypothetical protein FGIG_10554 [Fasciola gigantica]
MAYKKCRYLPRAVPYLRPLRAIDDSYLTKDVLNQLNLKPVKWMTFKFNPFCGSVDSIKNACFLMSNPRWRATNPNMVIKPTVASNYTEPTIEILYGNGKIVRIKTGNLTIREIVNIIYEQCCLNASESV